MTDLTNQHIICVGGKGYGKVKCACDRLGITPEQYERNTKELYDQIAASHEHRMKMQELFNAMLASEFDVEFPWPISPTYSQRCKPSPDSAGVLVQCETCIRKGKRECMYHGYPDDTIPKSCEYKIGRSAIDAVYDVPVMKRHQQDHEQANK